MSELTFEEFCQQPFNYVLGMTGDAGAHRMYRNDDLGIQKEVSAKRTRHGDIYSGWRDTEVYFFLDGDPAEYRCAAEVYVAWMAKVCGEQNG